MHILSLEKSIDLVKWFDENLTTQNEKEKIRPRPILQPTSRYGPRSDFLRNALEKMKETPYVPLVISEFYTGNMSHITFRSHEDKIYSWFESLSIEGTHKFSLSAH